MKCHYEVLGVPRDAGNDDLKKAYRKMALKWHPDKNPDNLTVAKEQFQLVQQAYEVLSDPHERAWYDDHREAILKGGLGGDFKDESLDLYQFFTASCFKGYGDDDKGFYSVYREVFNKVASEDSEFMSDEDSDFEVPSFGCSTSSYEEVVHPFYSYWQGYSTKKTFSWLDPYDIRDAPNRFVSRAIQKENKKVRDKARKERNEVVRNLVAFVRKRDKRVQAHAKLLEERAAENVKKAQEKRLKELRERQEALKNHKESEWSKFSNFEHELKQIEATINAEFGVSESSSCEEESGEEEACEEPPSNLYCVACNKMFKTERAFENHEKSKRHKECVEVLKSTMRDEEGEPAASSTEESEKQEDSDEEVSDAKENSESKKGNKKSKKGRKNIMVSPDPVFEEDSDAELNMDFGSSKKQRKKHRRKKIFQPLHDGQEEVSAGPCNGEASVPENEDSGKTQEAPKKLKGKKAKEARKLKAQLVEETNADESEKKPVQSQPSSVRSKSKKFEEDVSDLDHFCVKCKAEFPSKNKLFDHLKRTGHSVYLNKQHEETSKSKGKKSKQ